MEFTLNNQQVFPVGTTVKAYLASNWSQANLPPSGAPKGAVAAEAVVAADGDVDLTGLGESIDYWAAAEVGGSWRYIHFRTAVPAPTAESVEAQLEVVTRGANWQDGERLFGFSAQNAAGKKFELLQGTTLKPDEGNQSAAVITRVLKTPEASFSGDGAGNLAALRVHTTAVAGSEGQAIGIAASAITLGTYEAGHSLADGIGGYFLGISKGASTRTGMGAFVNGRREVNGARACGMELCVTNEVAAAPQTFTGTLPGTMGMHLHPSGQSDAAVGIVAREQPTTGVKFHTLIGVVNGAATDAVLADYSEAKRSILIKGKHEKAAIAIAKEAGPLLIGAEETANAAVALEVNTSSLNEARDPIANFKGAAGKSHRIRLIENGGTGQVSAFVAAGVNAFVVGTAINDSGIAYGPGTTFHIGANAKTSMFRASEAGLGFFGSAAVAKPEVTGSRATGAALTSLLEKLATLGLVTNGSTA